MANFLNGHSSETGPVKKIKKYGIPDLHIVTHLCQFMGQNSKIWGVKKIQQRFWKTEPLDSKPCQMPPGCHTPPKMVPPYSLGTCPPTTPRHFDTPLLLHQENIDFLFKDPWFWPKYSNGPGSLPKIDICQNWPQGALGDVSSCLETKFDKKMSMGSVPNCQKEIANRYGIRWFKCKLKLPKNGRIKIGGTKNLVGTHGGTKNGAGPRPLAGRGDP